MDANLPGTFLLNGPSLGPFPEAKAPVCQYSVQSSFYKLGAPGLAAGTPHGISDILGRPAAAASSALLPGYPHTGGLNGLSSPGVYYGPQVGALPKAGGEYLPRGRSCWAEAAPEWRGGARHCGGRKYSGARRGDWGWVGVGVPQVTGWAPGRDLEPVAVSSPWPCKRRCCCPRTVGKAPVQELLDLKSVAELLAQGQGQL